MTFDMVSETSDKSVLKGQGLSVLRLISNLVQDSPLRLSWPAFPLRAPVSTQSFPALGHTTDHSLSHLGKESLTLLYPYSPARACVFVLPHPHLPSASSPLGFGLSMAATGPYSQLLSYLYSSAHIPGLEPDESFSHCFGKVVSLSILGLLLRKDTSLEY